MIGVLSDCFHGAAPVQAGGFPCARSSGGRSDAHGLAHSIGSTEYQTGIRRFAGCPFQLVKKLACGDFFDDFCTVCLGAYGSPGGKR